MMPDKLHKTNRSLSGLQVKPTPVEASAKRLVAAVRAVRQHRQTAAFEDPETQAVWDHLQCALVETDRLVNHSSAGLRLSGGLQVKPRSAKTRGRKKQIDKRGR